MYLGLTFAVFCGSLVGFCLREVFGVGVGWTIADPPIWRFAGVNLGIDVFGI